MFIIFLVYICSFSVIKCGIFYYKNGDLGFGVSKGKYVCFKGEVNENGECVHSKVLKVLPLTLKINLFQTFNNLCNCLIEPGDERGGIEETNNNVFYLKVDDDDDDVFFQFVNGASVDNWLLQPNCNYEAFNCILNKHKIKI